MPHSMTAYGRFALSSDSKEFLVEIKSVNSRFLDCTVKLPPEYGFLEEKIKVYLQNKGILRGKINVFISINVLKNENTQILIDTAYAEKYIEALRNLRDRFGLSDDITVMRIAENKNVFCTLRTDEDADKLWNELLPALDGACESFIRMRKAEGDNLATDLNTKADEVRSLINFIKQHADDAQSKYRERLENKLRQTLDSLGVDTDNARILTECAIFADKTAIDEEIVRLESHFDAFGKLIASDDGIGRKLDFLIQEVNREVNTIGSKVSDIKLTETVIEIKTLLEKIREQIQNIE